MAAQGGDHVYVTLLLNDSYLPGALVLAHSLRDARTSKKLAVLVTLDSVSAESIAQLHTVYDYVFPVPRIRNGQPANLYLMNRADLHSAFTKINLWKLTQFSKVVYIDADVVAYRAPDELFAIPHPFSAAPDIGWPDLFNTGVMVLTPNMGDYYAMMAMADRGISFDGADQGLINMHFGNNYNRLSFTYNVTPSAHYQYVPAYRHFQSSINMVHFIGSEKPWFTGRDAARSSPPFNEMVGRWWAVYDRHYRAKETPRETSYGPSIEYVQYFTQGEFHPQVTPEQHHSTGEHSHHPGHFDPAPPPGNHPPPLPPLLSSSSPFSPPSSSSHPPPPQHHYQPPAPAHEQPPASTHGQPPAPTHEQPPAPTHEQPPAPTHEQPPAPTHDRHSAPAHEQPAQPPHQHHQEHNQTYHQTHHQEHQQEHQQEHHYQHPPDPDAPFQSLPPPPFAYVSRFVPLSDSVSNAPGTQAEAQPEQQVHVHHVEHQHHQHQHHDDGGVPAVEHKHELPQISMQSWDAQRQPPPPDSKPEAMNFPSMHYEMSQDTAHFIPPERYPSPPRDMWYEVPKERPTRAQAPPAIFPWEGHQPKPTRKFAETPAQPPVSEEPPPSEPVGESTTSLESIATDLKSEIKSEASTPVTPTVKVTPLDPWTSFTRVNAWDEVPEIDRYVEGLPWHRRVKSYGSSTGKPGGVKSPSDLGKIGRGGVGSFRLTDFPNELERPSLPVTPAPIRRLKTWGVGDPKGVEGGPKLPEAEGVPVQSDWVCAHGRLWGPADCLCELTDLVLHNKDPMERLQELAKQHSEQLLRKLGGEEGEKLSSGVSREIPSRLLPFGSTDASSPTYIAQSVLGVLSPQPVKGKASTSMLRSMSSDTIDPIVEATTTLSDPSSSQILPPNYSGPGVAWEPGEDVPLRETPVPPSNEALDMLDT